MAELGNKRLRIGDVLVQSGILTGSDIDRALDYSKEYNTKLGQAIVALGLATEADICNALGQQLNMPVYTDLSLLNIDNSVVQLLSEAVARQKRALAIEQHISETTGNRVITVVI